VAVPANVAHVAKLIGSGCLNTNTVAATQAAETSPITSRSRLSIGLQDFVQDEQHGEDERAGDERVSIRNEP
jgi:hypothetical protein